MRTDLPANLADLPHPLGMLHHGRRRRVQRQRVVRAHGLGRRRHREGCGAPGNGGTAAVAALRHHELRLFRLHRLCYRQISQRGPFHCHGCASRCPVVVLLRAGDVEKQRDRAVLHGARVVDDGRTGHRA
jgi:hypothetical protein